MIGFIMPNEKLSGTTESYAVSVDEVEQRIGIDFYYQLDDSIEDKLESYVDVNEWVFKQYKSTSSNSSSEGTSVQYKGVAKSTGNRCKSKTTNSNGYCHHHHGQVK